MPGEEVHDVHYKMYMWVAVVFVHSMIEIENVSFSYTKQQEALHGIDLNIPQGECLLLCGESGCGKTTVTRLINGLIPHFTAGEKLARTVGSVFQNPKSQFFNLDSDSEISFGLENEGLPPKRLKNGSRRQSGI